ARLVKRLDRADEQVQVDMLRYVASHKQTGALPEVRKALRSAAPAVRKEAINALHQLDPDAADSELIALLPASDAETRQAIKQVLLTSKNKQLTQLVTSALKDEQNADVQILLIDILGQRGAGESMPVILGIIGSEDRKST